jgi:hypothetical protein
VGWLDFNPAHHILHVFEPNFKTVNHVYSKNSYQRGLIDEKNEGLKN